MNDSTEDDRHTPRTQSADTQPSPWSTVDNAWVDGTVLQLRSSKLPTPTTRKQTAKTRANTSCTSNIANVRPPMITNQSWVSPNSAQLRPLQLCLSSRLSSTNYFNYSLPTHKTAIKHHYKLEFCFRKTALDADWLMSRDVTWRGNHNPISCHRRYNEDEILRLLHSKLVPLSNSILSYVSSFVI